VQHGIAPVFGGRPCKLSLVYVSDLVDGMVAAAESPLACGHTYFLAHPRAVSWEELYAAVGRAVKRRYLRLRLPLALGYAAALAADAGSRISGKAFHLSYQKMREIAQPGWVCAPTAAQRDFGFACRHDLDAGLQHAVEWYRDHGWL
jgi:nucleoside-diphosphate-sugar epimerase